MLCIFIVFFHPCCKPFLFRSSGVNTATFLCCRGSIFICLLLPVPVRVGFAFDEILRGRDNVERAAGHDIVFTESQILAGAGSYFQWFDGKAGASGNIRQSDVNFSTRGQAENHSVVPDCSAGRTNMIGGCFHPQPGVGAENGAGFVGLLVNIGLPAKDNVLRGFFDFVEVDAGTMNG